MYDNESLDHVANILEKENLVVVTSQKGKALGVITRIDLIEFYS